MRCRMTLALGMAIGLAGSASLRAEDAAKPDVAGQSTAAIGAPQSGSADGGAVAGERAGAGSATAQGASAPGGTQTQAGTAPAIERVANVEPAPTAAPSASVTADGLPAALRERSGQPASKLGGIEKDDLAAIAAHYGAANATALWVGKAGFLDRARAVMAEIRKADEWGLKAADYALPSLDGSSPSDDALADAEIRLTAVVLEYARHARGGRIAEPTSLLSSYIDRKPQTLEPAEVLLAIAKSEAPDAYLRDLHPKHPQFVALKAELGRQRNAGEAPKLVKIPQSNNKLQPGKSHPDVVLLRQRLGISAPQVVGASSDPALYDDQLAAAVKAFQADRGISPANGVVGASTRTALNAEPPTVSVRKIIANMEAWRWMPTDMGGVHVWVNIPEFTVRVVKNGEIIHAERVITGKVETQTPIFSDVMETVVIHPFWGVPESIKVKELWPGLARGGDTLARNGLKLQYNGREVSPQSVDWSSANIKNFHVYQPPGPGNVLGVVKFLFPNKHQVYMHDTPTKHLFATQMRTYSHGCMRVRNPVRLAEVLLGEDKGWDAARIAGLIKGGPQNNEIALTRKIPVHVTYFTAWADDTGKVQASKDFYGHEERVALALEGKWKQIARGKDHLAPVKAEPISRLAESKSTPATALGDFFKNLFGDVN